MGQIGQRIGGRGRARQGGQEAHRRIGRLCHAGKVRPSGGAAQAINRRRRVVSDRRIASNDGARVRSIALEPLRESIRLT
jgi:hypothetical protein